jgi:hypothetical protein
MRIFLSRGKNGDSPRTSLGEFGRIRLTLSLTEIQLISFAEDADGNLKE